MKGTLRRALAGVCHADHLASLAFAGRIDYVTSTISKYDPLE